MVVSSTSNISNTSDTSNTWIVDTAASSHMTSDRHSLENIREHGGLVRVANPQRMKVTGIGTVRLQCRLKDGSTAPAIPNDVLLVPELDSHGLFFGKQPAGKDIR